jgi:ribosome-associated protein
LPRTLAVRAARAAAEKQGRDIQVLQVRDLIAITDYFVIASGMTDRQVKAIGDGVEDELRRSGAKPIRREGERDMRWLLLDYADIIVHVFHEEDRAYYELERLWRDAPLVRWEPAASKAKAKTAQS